jgi:hypothetical protein
MQATTPPGCLVHWNEHTDNEHTEDESAQWESNPHFRHGKAAGYRYIMGAECSMNGQRAESTGWDSNPRCRITSAVSWPLDDQCRLSVGPDGLEPSPFRLRAGPGWLRQPGPVV